MTATQFMIVAQVVIFLLGWPLEWTEIIVIFMPIFLPLLAHFNVDPLFFGLLVRSTCRRRFCRTGCDGCFLPERCGTAARHTEPDLPRNAAIHALQVVAIALLYIFPQIGLWLPHLAYQ